jgi:sulfocyanin SoxE-like protein
VHCISQADIPVSLFLGGAHRWTRPWTVATLTAVVVGGSAALLPTRSSAEQASLLTSDPASQTATLRLVAGVDDGYNFNGYASGALVVAIPSGWRVTVQVRNASSTTSHSALVVAWEDRFKGSGLSPAFPGAAQPDFPQGITAQDPPARFVFTAGAVGKYSLVCGVPGHNLIGMWDELDVVEGGTPSSHVKAP